MPSTDEVEPLMINNWPIDRRLLERRALRRCNLGECQSMCCNGGVWIHTRQVADILAHVDLILPHMPPERRDPSQWFDGTDELDTDYPAAGNATGTAVVEDPTHPAGQTCVFLNADRLCALQAASIASGEHPWRFKPFYCALHPLGLDDGWLVLVEGSEVYQEGGTCSQTADDLIPVYQLFDVETKLVLGEEGYAALDQELKEVGR
jgi:hypothetical protein